MKGIHQTLYQFLFVGRSQMDAIDYRESIPALFPGVTDFIAFLQSEGQKAERLTIKILLRLCLESHFSPPTKLLANLAAYENQRAQKHSPKDQFIPQDHYRHLVHLYVLGIYLFSAHNGLHKQVSRALNNLRRRTLNDRPPCNALAELSNYQLFARFWTAFVLYHDLTYPLEDIEHTKAHSCTNEWIKPFAGLPAAIFKDMLIRGLSRLVAVNEAVVSLRHCDENKLADYFTSSDCDIWQMSERSGGSTKWVREPHLVVPAGFGVLSHAILMPNIHTQADLDVLRTIIPDDHICLAVEDVHSGALKRLFFCGSAYVAEGVHIVTKRGRKPRGHGLDIHRIWSRTLRLIGLARGEAWRVYALDSTIVVDRFIAGLFDANSRKTLTRLFESLRQRPEIESLIDSDEASLSDVAGEVYFAMNSELAFVAEPEARVSFASRSSGVLDEGHSSLAGQIPSLAAIALESVIRELIRTKDLLLQGSESLKDLSERVMQTFNGTAFRKKMAAELQSRATANLQRFFNSRMMLDGVYQTLKNKVSSDYQGQLPSFDPAFLDTIFLQASVSSSDAIRSMNVAESFALPPGLPPIADLYLAYRPTWVKDSFERFYDHGLYSAIVLAESLHFHRSLIEPVERALTEGITPLTTLLSLAAKLPDPAFVRELRAEADMLIREVGAALALHNLYPNEFGKGFKDYRTNRLGRPFLFFAILADGIQRWDRRVLGTVDGPQSRIGRQTRDFDIRIDGNVLELEIHAPGEDMAALEEQLRKGFAGFLQGARSMIRLRISS